MQGSLQLLNVSSLPSEVIEKEKVDDLTIESWIISNAVDASPDSMNLLPDHVSVIDLGNFILIRAGIDVEDEGRELRCSFLYFTPCHLTVFMLL